MTDSNGTPSLAGIPAAPPPPGVTPNYVNPYSDGPVLIIVGSVFVAIMLLFVSVRIYTKVKIVRKSSPDDYTCGIAATGIVGYFIIAAFAFTLGPLGTHIWDLPSSELSTKRFFLTELYLFPIPIVILLFAKLSFFLLYIQLFWPMNWLRYSAYAGAVVNVLFYTLALALTFKSSFPHPKQKLQQAFESPAPAHWAPMTLPTPCVNLVLDVYILLLPIAGISKLQLPIRKKMGTIAVFLTGLILVEMCVGVTASCMPSMSNLLHHLPNWKSPKWRFKSFLPVKPFSSTPGRSSGSQSFFSKPRRADYADLEAPKTVFGEHDYKMGSVKSKRTYIEAESAGKMEEDDIHLQYKVEQDSSMR